MKTDLATAAPAAAQFQLFSSGPDAPIKWRLLSANNREMARGSIEYASAPLCVQGIELLRQELSELRQVVRRTTGHAWQWELTRAAGQLVVAGHTFDRQIRCAQALQYFLTSAPHAQVTPAVMISAYRRWHSSAPVPQTQVLGASRGRSVR
jgi:hypothetical protein